MATYAPFCSLECNRDYSATVAVPDTANHDEPFCLNCGDPTAPRSTIPHPATPPQ